MKRVLFTICLVAISLLLSCQNICVGDKDNEVKNLIFLIGDGMGLSQVTMLQIENEGNETSFDRADNVALITTHSANNRVTDSAAAGTALATGRKANNGVLGMMGDDANYESIIERAIKAGKSTGLITTVYLQHATPAAFYANVPHRDSSELITEQLLNSNIELLIGGGGYYLKNESPVGGSYYDAFKEKGYSIARSLAEADDVDSGSLLCIVAEKDLKRAKMRGDFLPNALSKALELLSNNSSKHGNGFVLMVEGAQIDYAGHANNSKWLLDEMRDFDKTISIAIDYADKNENTLVVVVADHETGGHSVISNETDFTLSDSGVGYVYGTKSHSGVMVPVYLYGCGAELINGVMDNTELSQKLSKILGQN